MHARQPRCVFPLELIKRVKQNTNVAEISARSRIMEAAIQPLDHSHRVVVKGRLHRVMRLHFTRHVIRASPSVCRAAGARRSRRTYWRTFALILRVLAWHAARVLSKQWANAHPRTAVGEGGRPLRGKFCTSTPLPATLAAPYPVCGPPELPPRNHARSEGFPQPMSAAERRRLRNGPR